MTRSSSVFRDVSDCHKSLGNFSEAVEASKEALAVARSTFPPGNVILQICKTMRLTVAFSDCICTLNSSHVSRGKLGGCGKEA